MLAGLPPAPGVPAVTGVPILNPRAAPAGEPR